MVLIVSTADTQCRPFCVCLWKLRHEHPQTARAQGGWVNLASVKTHSFSLPQSHMHFLESEGMPKWLPTGSCMLCGYTASWGKAGWTNCSQASQVRLCHVGHSAFLAGQHVYGPVVLERWNGQSSATAETEAQGSGSFFPSPRRRNRRYQSKKDVSDRLQPPLFYFTVWRGQCRTCQVAPPSGPGAGTTGTWL